MTTPLHLTKTKQALEAFDAANAKLVADISTLSNLDFDLRMSEVDLLAVKVREAFAEETADRNNRETIMKSLQIDPWLRQMVAKYGA